MGDKTLDEIGLLWVDWALLQQLLADMETVGGQIEEVAAYARDEVFNGEAFDHEIPLTGVSVLKPISDALSACGDVIDDVQAGFSERWTSLTAAVALSAKDFDATDGGVTQAFLKPYLDLVEES